MRTLELLERLEFDAKRPHAVPLFVDEAGRVLCFTLRPGQSLKEHNAPGSPLYLGPHSLAILDRGETHSVRALDEDLAFVAFLHGEKTAREGKITGRMARKLA